MDYKKLIKVDSTRIKDSYTPTNQELEDAITPEFINNLIESCFVESEILKVEGNTITFYVSEFNSDVASVLDNLDVRYGYCPDTNTLTVTKLSQAADSQNLQSGDIYNDGTVSGKVVETKGDEIVVETVNEDGEVVNVLVKKTADNRKARKARRTGFAKTKFKDSRKSLVAKSSYKKIKLSDSYKSLLKKIKDELEETESTQEAVEVALANINEETTPQEVVTAVVEVFADVIESMEDKIEELEGEETEN